MKWFVVMILAIAFLFTAGILNSHGAELCNKNYCAVDWGTDPNNSSKKPEEARKITVMQNITCPEWYKHYVRKRTNLLNKNKRLSDEEIKKAWNSNNDIK